METNRWHTLSCTSRKRERRIGSVAHASGSSYGVTHRGGNVMGEIPKSPAEPKPGRRTFLGWLTGGLAVVATAVLGIPIVGYLFGARKAPVKWVPLGPI